MWLKVKPPHSRTLESPFVSSCPPSLLFPSSTVCCLLYMWHWSCFRNPVQMFSILVQSLLCFQIAAELGLWWEEAQAGRGREEERGRRQTGSPTPNTATVKVESTERETSVKKVGKMGQGQKGSSDKEKGKKQKRDESPAPEDGRKCRVCRFPLLVALLQLLLGVAVTAVAFLMLAISPSLLARETPHWAGIIVSSILSL